MSDDRRCADSAIKAFVQKLGPDYQNWAGLIPGDTTNGWAASKVDWRKQAADIIGTFEACSGHNIAYSSVELDNLRSMTLADFSDYLCEKAELLMARIALRHVERNLAALELRIRTFKVTP